MPWNLLTVLLAAAMAVCGCGRRPAVEASGPPVPVTLGFGVEADNALALLADQQKLFDAANVSAAVSNFPSGKLALGALLKGEVEIATAAQTPIVTESFSRRDLRILAVLGTSDNMMKIVVRKDAGISAPGDLRGKRIATQPLSFMHFFLDLFLLKNGVQPAEASLVFGQPDALPAMLERGEAEAASLREPLTSQALAKLGGKAAVFEEPGLCVRYYILVTTEGVLRDKPEAVRGVLRALLEAGAIARENPSVVESIIRQRLKVDAATAQGLRREVDLRVSLPQSLLVSLEDEARWVMSAQPGGGGTIPNYLEYLAADPLSDLQPDAVTVIY